MSETMVERVAKGIWARRRSRSMPALYLAAWEDETEGLRFDVMAEARAAIEAMWDPTPEMIAAGLVPYNLVERVGMPEYGPEDSVELTYSAMIDAALAETTA